MKAQAMGAIPVTSRCACLLSSAVAALFVFSLPTISVPCVGDLMQSNATQIPALNAARTHRGVRPGPS
eukprot:scaffold3951_cov258-Pinguiococcus_pyrenoidosus.AAC.1